MEMTKKLGGDHEHELHHSRRSLQPEKQEEQQLPKEQKRAHQSTKCLVRSAMRIAAPAVLAAVDVLE